jgi:chromosome segregation ATPase
MDNDGLIEYKDGYRMLRINPDIKPQLLVLELRYQRLDSEYIKLRNRVTKLEKKLNEETRLKLKPLNDRIRDINTKKNRIWAQRRAVIEDSCTHKTRVRWSGGDYNEHMVRECMLCDKDFGEVP